MNCIAVDDEPLALSLIEDFSKKVPFLNFIKSCKNAFEAIDIIQKEKIDLVFLDINMPDISGIELIKNIENKPLVIFTTAYQEYALEGYNLDVVDYLLKPILFPRFLKAVSKAQELFQLKTKPVSSKKKGKENSEKPEKILLKSGTDIHQVFINDILYIEGARNYLFVYTKEKKIMTLMRMKELEDQLPSENFIRIHKSFIISSKHIDLIERHQVTINEKQIPIGRNYREMFLKAIAQK